MNYLSTLLLLLILLLGQNCHKQAVSSKNVKIDFIDNPIDSIESIESLQLFLQKEFSTSAWGDYRSYIPEDKRFDVFENCDNIMDSLSIGLPFRKTDINEDGLTDLILISRYRNRQYVEIVIAGHNNFRRKRLTGNGICSFVDFLGSRDPAIITMVYDQNDEGLRYSPKSYFKTKDVTYQDGNLIEVEVDPLNYKIDSFVMVTSGCYGDCPSYKIVVRKEGDNSLSTIRYNERLGNSLENGKSYSSSFDQPIFQSFENLINRIDFHLLDSTYSVNHTDDQTATTTVYYRDGRIKKIRDYGMEGTLGLELFYSTVGKLHRAEGWVKL